MGSTCVDFGVVLQGWDGRGVRQRGADGARAHLPRAPQREPDHRLVVAHQPDPGPQRVPLKVLLCARQRAVPASVLHAHALDSQQVPHRKWYPANGTLQMMHRQVMPRKVLSASDTQATATQASATQQVITSERCPVKVLLISQQALPGQLRSTYRAVAGS